MVATVFWWNLWQLRNQEAVPNPDIFQYIDDGREYLRFRLPASIHPPPLAPVFITIVAKIITPFTVYHELAAVHFINITCAALLLINVYLLSRQFTSPLVAFALSVLVATNQIYTTFSLGVTSEIIYAFFLTLSLLLYLKSRHSFSYLIFGLLFLLRYESIVVPISVFIVEYLYDQKKFKLKNVILSFFPIIIWLIVLNFHSWGTSLIDNAYLVEIWQNNKKIPNLLSFQALVEIITFEPSSFTSLKYQFVYIIIGLTFYGAVDKKATPIVRILYLIFIFHLLFLYLFPNFNIRYYLPIIWIAYLVLINHHSRLVTATAIICLLVYNIGRINTTSLFSSPNENSEYRLVANWINEQKFDSKVKVIIYEPWILDYFVTNPNVDILGIWQTPLTACKGDIACTARIINSSNPNTDMRYDQHPNIDTTPRKNSGYQNNNPVYVISPLVANRTLNSGDDIFTANIHFTDSFKTKNFSKNTFEHIVTVEKNNHWAAIYKYIPDLTNSRL